jgi:hypothetical protein
MARKRKPRNRQAAPAQTPAQAAPQSGIDTKPFVAEIEKNVPADLLPIYKTAVLKGDMQMFGKETHQMTLEQLNKPGPMAPKLAEGIVALVYILFQKSNKTLPPQILEPAGVTLLCHAFDFLQQAGDPEATKETLGEAVDQFRVGIHNALGVSEEQFQQALQQHGQQQKPGILADPAAQQPGILGDQNG